MAVSKIGEFAKSKAGHDKDKIYVPETIEEYRLILQKLANKYEQ